MSNPNIPEQERLHGFERAADMLGALMDMVIRGCASASGEVGHIALTDMTARQQRKAEFAKLETLLLDQAERDNFILGASYRER